MINTAYTFTTNLDFREKHADITNDIPVAVANLKNSEEFKKQVRDKQVELGNLRAKWAIEFDDKDLEVKGQNSYYYPYSPKHPESQFVAIDTD